jgi:hypothetical protein
MPMAITARIHRSITPVVSARSHSPEKGRRSLMPYTLVQSSSRCDATAIRAAKKAAAQRTGLRPAKRTIATDASAITGIAARECVRWR